MEKRGRYVESAEANINGQRCKLELVQDEALMQDVSYVLRAYRALAAFKKGNDIEVGVNLRPYLTRLPAFSRDARKGIAINAAALKRSSKRNEYYLLVDERLEAHERIAVLAHQIGHFAGGYQNNDNAIQKIALKTLANLIAHYKGLSNENNIAPLRKLTSIKFRADEKNYDELKSALKYLIESGNYFVVNQTDWEERRLKAVRPNGENRIERGLGMFFMLIGLFFALYSLPMITGNFLNINYDYKIISFPFIAIALFVIGGILVRSNRKYRRIEM